MNRNSLMVLAVSFMACMLFFSFYGAGIAQATDVCGSISSDTTWDLAGSPYIVTCGVIVDEGVTLTIEPGVEVLFDGSYAIMVNGELIARGTESDMITFTSNQPTPAPGDWAHIKFSDSSVDAAYDVDENYVSGSILEYCLIEYAGYANKGGVYIDYSGPFINHCNITNCSGSKGGIYAYYADNLQITNNTIIGNMGSGISCDSGVVNISGNTISNNSASLGGGIYCSAGNIALTISNNNITSNSASFGGGIHAYSGNTIIGNTISGNSASNWGGGIYANGGTITNNTISNNSASSGGGIYTEPGGAAISNNTISSNSAYNGGGFYGSGMITGNTISSNSAYNGGGLFSAGTVTDNTISNNSATRNGGAIYNSGNSDISDNRLENNSAGTCGGIYIGSGSSVINGNDLLNLGTYEVYNNSSDDINAENNWWGTTLESEIKGKIFDWYYDSAKGLVDYNPWLAGPGEDMFPDADAGGPYSGKVGDVINFNGSGSSDPDGSIVSWEWDFGDGDTANGETVTHSYNAPGTYTVSLTVTDNDGFSDTDTTTAEITCTDADNDGYYIEAGCDTPPIDCDDGNPSIHPGADNLCDGLDNDCDGVTDEGCNSFGDVDRDGDIDIDDVYCLFKNIMGRPSCMD